MVTPTITVLNQPLVTQEEIIAVIKRDLPKDWNIPVYEDYPSESEKVRYGVYVSEIGRAHV